MLSTPLYPPQTHTIDLRKPLKKCARLSIPWSCNTNYIQGLTKVTKTYMQNYPTLFEANHLGEGTIEVGKQLISSICEAKRKSWIKRMEKLDIRKSSHKAWRLLRRLNVDPTHSRGYAKVTADQIHTQQVKNCKPHQLPPDTKPILTEQMTRKRAICSFTIEVKIAQPKPAWLNDILTKQIRYFECKIVAIGYVQCLFTTMKDASNSNSYRSIPLLCHAYTILW